MNNLCKYGLRIVVVTLFGGALIGCGSAAAPNAAGPTATTELATPSATMTIDSTNTAEATQTSTPMSTVESTPSVAPTATMEPTQPASPTSTMLPAPTVGESSSTAQPAGMGETVEANIKLFMFKPDPLEVQSGTTVVWTNQDDIDHSVTEGTPAAAGQVFDSGLFGLGKNFSFTFSEPGEYSYFCRRHNSMVGTLRVVGN